MKPIVIPLSKTGKHAGKYAAIVSPEDADLAELNWNVLVDKRHKTPYAARTEYTPQGKQSIRLHREVMKRMLGGRELLPNEEVDHINGDGLLNTRDNLRLATRVQNMTNRGAQANNTSGYKGVSWHKRDKKWCAKIVLNGKRIHLGLFNTPEEAHEAYCAKAKELHGEYVNFGEVSE